MDSVRDALYLCCHALFTTTAYYLDLRDTQYKSTKDDWMHHAYILTKVCEFDCALEVE